MIRSLPDPGVNVGVVRKQPFMGGMVEVRPMIDAGLLGRRPAKDLGLPRVAVHVSGHS